MFGFADDILIVDYNKHEKHHDRILYRVFHIHRKVNLKLNKYTCHFRCTSVPGFGEIISRRGIRPESRKLKHSLTCHLQSQKGVSSISWSSVLFKQLSPAAASMCKPLQKLTSVKTEWTWNKS